MNKKRKIIIILLALAAVILCCVLMFTGCTADRLEHQNSILSKFNIDFITTKYSTLKNVKGGDADVANSYLIDITDLEREKMNELVSNDTCFCNAVESPENYQLLLNKLDENFTNFPYSKYCRFAVYNKISDCLIDVSNKPSLEKFDFDYYYVLIYNSDSGEIYIYDYSKT